MKQKEPNQSVRTTPAHGVPSQRAAATVLVALPDKILQEVFESVAGAEGLHALAAGAGRHVVEIASRGRPSMIIIANSYRDLSGSEVVRRLRGLTGAYIVVVERGATEDQRIELLEAGADQIVDGRYSPREHQMRLRALLRRVRPVRAGEQSGAANAAGRDAARGTAPASRTSGWRTAGVSSSVTTPSGASRATATAAPTELPAQHVLVSDGLAVDTTQHICWLNDEELSLTRTEFRILVAMMRGRPDGSGRLLTKSELVGVVGGSGADRSALRSLEVHVGNLRRKLGEEVRSPRWIRTVRSVGYHWLQPVEAVTAADIAERAARKASEDMAPVEQLGRSHHLRMVN
ncbi:response regulator transcription factor [Zhihengliuella halotolerans]|uniref:DNA-binding response OmpR family regulator n=1 Tax=Zhihengliuella halotolerans TaxID=370736 RepID=A0A4Q8A9Y1_9MICC|nr:response regulator transcription factor [Zhihengliuella halotolerans]RZU60848.1 DNA-binding response OmpR family regulator [Zhihengliuella halotolerans]